MSDDTRPYKAGFEAMHERMHGGAAMDTLENAQKRAEYWKAEHLAANAEIERLRTLIRAHVTASNNDDTAGDTFRPSGGMICWALVDKAVILQESEVDKMNEMQEQEGTIEGPTKLYEVLGLIEELHDEADLCRNETATDIAYMLETAADMIDSLKDDVLTLTRRLMGENEDSFSPETLEVFRRWCEVCMTPNP